MLGGAIVITRSRGKENLVLNWKLGTLLLCTILTSKSLNLSSTKRDI